MALRTFNSDYFITQVAPYVTGCPRPVIASTVKRIVSDFLRQTGVYRYTHPDVTLVAGTLAYALTPPAGTLVSRLVSLSTLGALPANGYIEAGQLRFASSPPDGVIVTPVLELGLDPAATSVDDTYLARWIDTIADGTLADLMMIPDRQWTDQNRAPQYANKYRRGKHMARNDLFSSYTVGNTMMAGPKFV